MHTNICTLYNVQTNSKNEFFCCAHLIFIHVFVLACFAQPRVHWSNYMIKCKKWGLFKKINVVAFNTKRIVKVQPRIWCSFKIFVENIYDESRFRLLSMLLTWHGMYDTARHSMAQLSIARHCTAEHSMTWHRIVWHGTAYSMSWHSSA